MHLFLPRRKPVMDTGLLIPSENYLKKLSVKTALLSSRYVSGPSEFDSEELLRGYECKKDFVTLLISFPFLLYFGEFRMPRWRRQQERQKKQTNKQSSSFRLAKRQLNFARAALFLVHFFVVTTRLRRKISCFMENVSKR